MSASLLDPELLRKSAPDALRELDPRTLWRNPVMLIVVGLTYFPALALGPLAEGLH